MIIPGGINRPGDNIEKVDCLWAGEGKMSCACIITGE